MQAQATASDLATVRDPVVLTQLVCKCTQEPPIWAKELLEQQKQCSTELKKIKKDLEAAKRSKQEKPNESEPEFKFEGNKKQYKLNRNVLDKNWLSYGH